MEESYYTYGGYYELPKWLLLLPRFVIKENELIKQQRPSSN